ncbi:MAG: hypothetical protein SFY81_15860 [Verrucomicrobiota bacterium]|nr:hypothetical protein [Verrucomicrobiota bacterium]
MIRCTLDSTFARTCKQGATLVLLLFFALALTGCFRVSRETQVLRDSALHHSSGEWDEKLELALGGLTFGAASLGSRWIEEIPAEVRSALASVKGAEVSIHTAVKTGKVNGQKLLKEADGKMKGSGWYRVVGYREGNQLVAIYLPEKSASNDTRVCVLVLQETELVCVSARTDLRRLMKIALEKAQEDLPARVALVSEKTGA